MSIEEQKRNQWVYECMQTDQEPLFDENKPEEKPAYLILKQRYKNLQSFLKVQEKIYTGIDAEELQRLWYIYNDLKEIHFVGTDLYANAVFVKHEVPYLYRSVGRDTGNRVLEGKEDAGEIGKMIFKEGLEQIKSGGKGKLYSYSKCFGRMLYKYANIKKDEWWIINDNKQTTIEIRKSVVVNVASEDGTHMKSLQRYIRDVTDAGVEVDIPYFSVDFSNARDDSVNKGLKPWFDEYLGKQEYIRRNNDIYDPIGDAEVLCNFTNRKEDGSTIFATEVIRLKFSVQELCVLLYEYFKEFTKRKNISFDYYITKSLETLRNCDNGGFSDLYESIVNRTIGGIDRKKIDTILQHYINWDKELFYMSRCKAEKGDASKETPHMDVYKEGDVEPTIKNWKDIISAAVEQIFMNYVI